MCIDIVEIWFGIANGQITSIFWQLSSHDTILAGYYWFTFLLLIIQRLYKCMTNFGMMSLL